MQFFSASRNELSEWDHRVLPIPFKSLVVQLGTNIQHVPSKRIKQPEWLLNHYKETSIHKWLISQRMPLIFTYYYDYIVSAACKSTQENLCIWVFLLVWGLTHVCSRVPASLSLLHFGFQLLKSHFLYFKLCIFICPFHQGIIEWRGNTPPHLELQTIGKTTATVGTFYSLCLKNSRSKWPGVEWGKPTKRHCYEPPLCCCLRSTYKDGHFLILSPAISLVCSPAHLLYLGFIFFLCQIRQTLLLQVNITKKPNCQHADGRRKHYIRATSD